MADAVSSAPADAAAAPAVAGAISPADAAFLATAFAEPAARAAVVAASGGLFRFRSLTAAAATASPADDAGAAAPVQLFEPYLPVRIPGDDGDWRFGLTPVRDCDAAAQLEMNNNPRVYAQSDGPPLPYTQANADRYVVRNRDFEAKEFARITAAAAAAAAGDSSADATNETQPPVDDWWWASRWFPLQTIRDFANGDKYAGEVAMLRVDVGDDERVPGRWVIGCNIHPDHQGRGLATAAVRAVLECWGGSRNPACSYVIAECWTTNTGSRRVYEKNGFVLDAQLSGTVSDVHPSRGTGTREEVIYRLQYAPPPPAESAVAGAV